MWLLWNATSRCSSFLSSWQCTEICTKTHFRTQGGFAVYLNAMWEWSPSRIYMHWSECCDKNWKPRMIASVLRGVAKFGLCTKFLLGLMPQRNWPRVDFLFFYLSFMDLTACWHCWGDPLKSLCKLVRYYEAVLGHNGLRDKKSQWFPSISNNIIAFLSASVPSV